MKWFKHDVDASDDIKIRRLEEEFGNDGYAIFFKSLEILGKESKKMRLKFENYPKKWISNRCHVSEEKLTTVYEFMSKILLCCPKSLKNNELYMPNFKKRADDYTKRIQRLSEQPTNKVPLDKKRLEKIITEYIRLKDWGDPKAEILSSIYQRNSKAAKQLILLVNDDDKTVEVMNKMAKTFGEKELSWTLETVIKHLPDILANKFGNHKPNPKGRPDE